MKTRTFATVIKEESGRYYIPPQPPTPPPSEPEPIPEPNEISDILDEIEEIKLESKSKIKK